MSGLVVCGATPQARAKKRKEERAKRAGRERMVDRAPERAGEAREPASSTEDTMADAKNDRRQALELALSQIERQFGKGAVMRLGSGKPLEEIAVIPTGALSLDVALGVGGLPRGRVIEIYGPESSGKTTLALHVVSEA